MTLDGLDCFTFPKIICFPNELLFPATILRAVYSIDICTVKIKNIGNMHAVLTNQITDIWHFNNKGKNHTVVSVQKDVALSYIWLPLTTVAHIDLGRCKEEIWSVNRI